MIWVILAGGVVVAMATTSLLGTWQTRREMATGHPDYFSLADYTGEFDRTALESLCGPPDAEDRYLVSAEVAKRLPRRTWSLLFDSLTLDIACLIASCLSAWLVMTHRPGAWWVVGTVLAYQVLGWTVAVSVVVKARNAAA